jgi:hypothetical protein
LGLTAVASNLVFAALETANVALQRPVSTAEVIQHLSGYDARKMHQEFKHPSGSIRNLLTTMVRRGVIYSRRDEANGRYYASPRIVEQSSIALPRRPARQLRVLDAARKVALKLGRGVRATDIVTHGNPEDLQCLSAKLVNESLVGLLSQGRLRVVGRVRGRQSKLYLPVEMDAAAFQTDAVLSRQDAIVNAFRHLWEERTLHARETATLPTPVTGYEIRERVENDFGDMDSTAIFLSIRDLEIYGTGGFRRVIRGSDLGPLWAPTDVPDERLDLVSIFASDAERAAESVRRAVHRLGRPVTASEAAQESKSDKALEPIGSLSLRATLSNTLKGPRRAGVRHRMRHGIHLVGQIGLHAYYSPDVESGAAYIDYQREKRAWGRANLSRLLERIDGCSLQSVATGRSMLVASEVACAKRSLVTLVSGNLLPTSLLSEATDLLDEISAVETRVSTLLQHVRIQGLPETLDTVVPAWTTDEVWQALRGRYTAVFENGTRKNLMDTISKSGVRRVSDQRYHGGGRRTVYFDRTEALLFAALQWGSHECSMQASICVSELGDLRDHRFVMQELSSPKVETRLRAVACCAFLSSEACLHRLRGTATTDSDIGVREVALWAYGFAGGNDAIELMRQAISGPQQLPNKRHFEAAIRHGLDWWSM